MTAKITHNRLFSFTPCFPFMFFSVYYIENHGWKSSNGGLECNGKPEAIGQIFRRVLKVFSPRFQMLLRTCPGGPALPLLSFPVHRRFE